MKPAPPVTMAHLSDIGCLLERLLGSTRYRER
jgi:hypothetical protein